MSLLLKCHSSSLKRSAFGLSLVGMILVLTSYYAGHYPWHAGDSTRVLWLYDSFEGMPRSTAEDTKITAGSNMGDLAVVNAKMRQAGLSMERVRLKVGYFDVVNIPTCDPSRHTIQSLMSALLLQLALS